MKPTILGPLAYIVATFVTQAGSHFAINRAHYAEVSFMRSDPIFSLGILSMIIQGVILTYLYGLYARGRFTWGNGWGFGLLVGTFFVSYPALAEAAKFQVPSVLPWIAVEGIVGLLQFSIFGILLAMIYSKFNRPAAV